jgi:hypothetical protein
LDPRMNLAVRLVDHIGTRRFFGTSRSHKPPPEKKVPKGSVAETGGVFFSQPPYHREGERLRTVARCATPTCLRRGRPRCARPPGAEPFLPSVITGTGLDIQRYICNGLILFMASLGWAEACPHLV